MTDTSNPVFEAIEACKVELSPAEEARIGAFFDGNPNVSPMAASALANTLTAISNTPAGAATLLRKDIREIMVPMYGQEFVQRLNKDEALLMNDVTSAITRHLRESGIIPFVTPVSDENPNPQPMRTSSDPAPRSVGYDYNRRGASSSSSMPTNFAIEDDSALHNDNLAQSAAGGATVLPPDNTAGDPADQNVSSATISKSEGGAEEIGA